MNFIVLTYRIDLEGTWFISYTTEEERDIFVRQFLTAGYEEELALILVGIALWIRVFYSLRLIPYVGPIIIMFFYILKELLGYFLLLCATFLILAACGTLLFKDLSNFDTYSDSLITLFETCWGEFNFSVAKEGRFGNWLGNVFMIFVVIAIILVLANFLIALFASKYSDFRRNMKAIMMNEALRLRPVMEADETHSSLISGPFPLHGLNWITPPFMFLPRSPRVANEITLHIMYLPIAIIVTCIFFCYNLIIWPIAYLKLIPHKFALIFKKNVAFSGNGSNRFGGFLLIFFFGIIILFLNLCVDMFYFVVHLYTYDLEKVDDEDEHVPDMSIRTYHKLYTYLESHTSPYMGYKKVASEIRDQLDIMTAIRQMLFPHRAILKNSKYQRNPENLVNEYIIVKKILLNNSIIVSTTKLYPNSVKKITKELRFNKRILQYTLLDMLRFRKLLLLKRREFLFTIMYGGMSISKDKATRKRKEQVERTIAD